MGLTDMFNRVDGQEDSLIAIRRDLHHYAETGWTEFRTTSQIMRFLEDRGIPYQVGLDVVHPDYVWSYPSEERIAFHQKRAIEQGADPAFVERMSGYSGVVATIETGHPGDTIAFRFDMDCNDMEETASPDHRPFREGFSSVNANCAHCCGHDGHTAMGLILADVLYKHRDELCGTIKIIYQPAEEGDKGAQSMVERGVLDGVSRVFSVHILPTPHEGKVGLAGTQMGLYATTKFDVTIFGKNSHAGAYPELGHNAIQAAVMAISSMNAFMQDGRGASRLNIGTIEGGTGRNVIPNVCKFRAETRGSTTEVEKRLYDATMRCVQAACDTFECTSKCEIMGYGPCGGGDPALAEDIIAASQAVEGLEFRDLFQHNTGGTDDFTYMMQRVTEQGGAACYLGLLTDIVGGVHNDAYDFDERCLALGVKSCIATLWKLSGRES